MFCSDKPIEKSKDDRLNRKLFSKKLAQAILTYTGQDNFTISLCGKWGTGKTSIINMVVEEIDKQTHENELAPVIIRFNPWNYSDKSQLISQFFKTLLDEKILNSSDGKLKSVGSALQKYSDVMEYTSFIPVVGQYLQPLKTLLANAGQNMTETAEKNESIEKLKDKVVNALKEQQRKIIVIIDDIDRLNNEQIRLIFQLVNCVAGFPNMIYLLSFDKQVVVRALEDEQKCNGEEYLEKIIQVPFHVPAAKSSDVQQIFFDNLDKILFGENTCANFDQEYWSEVFSTCISPFINTIRDVNRVINVYKFKYDLMCNETNCIDLLAITTFQVCAPNIFAWIIENIDRLTGSYYGKGTSGVEQKEYRSKIIEEFKNFYDNPEQMLQVLQPIFPKFAWYTGGYIHNCETEDELRFKQKIACPDRTQLYFRLSLEDVAVPKNIVTDSIIRYTTTELDILFGNLIERESIIEYLKELNAHAHEIPTERVMLFVEKLIQLQTLNITIKKRSLFDISPDYFCSRCIWTILKHIGPDDSCKIFNSLIRSLDNDSFSVLVNMFVSVEKSYARMGEDLDYNYRIISEEALDSIEDAMIGRIKIVTSEKCIFDLCSYWGIYWFWRYKDKASMDGHIQKILCDVKNIPKYLVGCASFWTGGRTNGWTFKQESVEEYISVDNAYKGVLSIKCTDAFSTLKSEEKQIAIAFYLWYNSNRKEHYDINKETIDALIPEWEKK